MGHYIKRSKESGSYGWCYAYGRDQRKISEAYKDGYDQIDWSAGNSLGEHDMTRLGHRGKAKVWVFGPERFKNE